MIANTQPTRSIATMVCWSAICTGLITSAALGGGADAGISELPDGSVLFALPDTVANQQPPWPPSYMGGAIASSIDYMAIAAPGAAYPDGTDSGVGVVLVYSLKGMTPEQPPELFGVIHIPYDSGDSFDIDSVSLDIYQDEILVGVSGADGGDGAIHVYKIDNLDTPFQSVMGSGFFGGNNNYSKFGASVAFLHDAPFGIFAVGAPEAGSGAVVLFAGESGGYYDAWYLSTPSGLPSHAKFGAALATQAWDEPFAVSAPWADNGSLEICGAVFIVELIDDDYEVTQTVWPPTPAALQSFGTSISMVQNVLAVGAPRDEINDPGVVHMFAADPKAGTFGHLATLTPGTSMNEDKFGASVALGPGLALAVGVPGADDDGDASGACVLFDYAPSSEQVWVESTRLTSYLAATEAEFGRSVAFRTNDGGAGALRTLVVGSPKSETALMYHSQGPTDPWVDDVRQPAPIRLEDSITAMGPGYDNNSWSVAVDGDRMVVGDTYGSGPGDGRVRLYERDSADQWTLRHTWTAPEAGSYFGADVDISGDVVVIGAQYANPANGQYHGMAYVSYFLNDTWSALNSLYAGNDVWYFGCSVAIENGDDIWNTPATIAVGEAQDEWNNANATGRVHIFYYQFGYETHQSVLTPWSMASDPNPNFGASVDLSQGRLVVGAPGTASVDPDDCVMGCIYLANADAYLNGNWDTLIWNPLFEWPLPPHDCQNGSGVGGSFGSDVAISGDKIVVGAPRSGNVDRPDTGLTWLFDWNLLWPATPLVPMDLQTADLFGASVAINGDTVLVGAPGSDFGATNGGLVWRFNAADGLPSEALMLRDVGIQAALGSSVAVTTSGAGSMATVTMVAAAPSLADDNGNLGAVATFTSEVVANWIAPGDGFWEANENAEGFWSMPPEDAYLWRFSKWLGSTFIVTIYDQMSFAGIDVFIANVILTGDSTNNLFDVQGDLTIGGPPEMGVSRLQIDDLRPMRVYDELSVGTDEGTGELAIAASSWIQASGGLNLTGASSLGLFTSGVANTGNIVCDAGTTVSIGGTCTLIGDEGTYTLGDRLVLVQADSAPPEDQNTFDMVVLPGLGDGLAFQLLYEDVDTVQGTVWQVVAQVVDITDLIGFGEGGSYAVDGDPIDMVLGDLNGDGADEICVLFGGSPGELYIFENDGSGGIDQQIIIEVGDGPVDLAYGDIDGGSGNDLIVANVLSSNLTLLFNDGDFTDGFTNVDFALTDPPSCLAAINIDGDGLDDLVVGFPDVDADGNGRVELYYGASSLFGGGLGGGGGADVPGDPGGLDPSREEDQKDQLFYGSTGTGQAVSGRMAGGVAGPTLSISSISVGTELSGVANGDIDGDGDEDIVLSAAGSDQVIFLLREGETWVYDAPLYIPMGTDPARVIAEDLDGDGTIDIAAMTTNTSGDRVIRVLQNDGNLSFTSIDTADGDDPALFGAGDVTGNGSIDLITVSAAVSLMGTVQEVAVRPVDNACVGDIDGNGAADVDDLMILIGQWGNDCEGGAECTADLDGNSLVDVDDLVLLIGVWGDC